MKIKIVNETSENTAMLRKIVRVVALHKGINGNIYVRFIKSRSAYTISGRARVGKRYSCFGEDGNYSEKTWHIITNIAITKNWKTESLASFLQVLFHEFDHTLGLTHREMMKVNKLNVFDVLPEVVRIILSYDKKAFEEPILAESE